MDDKLESLIIHNLKKEMADHLSEAHEWAHHLDMADYDGGWSCINSIKEALETGNVGLALTRWDGLITKPFLFYDFYGE